MPRRRTLLLALVAVGPLLLSACGDDGDEGAEAASGLEVPEGAWSFESSDGEVIELDETPQRIVMFEDVAASLMDLGVRPVGIHHIQGRDGNRLFEGMDLDGIGVTGEICDDVNIEQAAQLEPDVFVYMTWAGEGFCLNDEQKALLEEIAPVLEIEAMGDSTEIRQRYIDLAESFGADLDGPEIAAKRERFDDAEAALRDALDARPEISLIPMTVDPEGAGIAEPAGFPDLVALRDHYGVDFVGPFDDDEFTETYWEFYSPETSTTYRGDVILMDSKNETPLEDKIDGNPLWAALPEVQAGQIVPWFVPGSFSYTRDAEFMEALARAILDAEDLVP